MLTLLHSQQYSDCCKVVKLCTNFGFHSGLGILRKEGTTVDSMPTTMLPQQWLVSQALTVIQGLYTHNNAVTVVAGFTGTHSHTVNFIPTTML